MNMTEVDFLRSTIAGAETIGGEVGAAHREHIIDSVRRYGKWFQNWGISSHRIEKYGQDVLSRIRDWRPNLAQELLELGSAATVDPALLAALNARTELMSDVMRTAECSAVVELDRSSPFGIQTWDWMNALAPRTALIHHAGASMPFATVAEHGVVGKIGLNAAGLALHFTILHSPDDCAGKGIPVHLLARAVLEEAHSAHDAVELLKATPVTASSTFVVNDGDTAFACEVSPKGVTVRSPDNTGRLCATNHFFDTDLEMLPGSTTTVERLEYLSQLPKPSPQSDLEEWLLGPGDRECPLVMKGYPGPFKNQVWDTLLTVISRPKDKKLEVVPSHPLGSEQRFIVLLG